VGTTEGRDATNRLALTATLHCLAGCSIGEVLGMVIGTLAHLGNLATILLSVILAFSSGYLLTMIPLLRSGIPLGRSVGLALASDTVSIVIMEAVDNAIMLVIPGAMDAGLGEFRFWGSLLLSLLIAGAAAYPVVRMLIRRGRGHAAIHGHHAHGHPAHDHPARKRGDEQSHRHHGK
jgi:hypothetical protein